VPPYEHGGSTASECPFKRTRNSLCGSSSQLWTRSETGFSGIGLEQEVATRRACWCFHLEHASPTGRVAGGLEFGRAVASAGAAGEDEFAARGELEQGAVGEVGAGAVVLRGEAVESGVAITVGPAARPAFTSGVCKAQVRA